MNILFKLLFGWILSAIVIVGPYAALKWGLPWAVENHLDVGFDTEQPVQRLVALVDYNYWWVCLVYIILAGLITPSYDRENMGLFGTFVDNPFSYEDDVNRTMFAVMILLAPGKVVWVTAHTTFVEIRDALFG